tara:strand:- start:10 stop:825 length:816 start_codon:yes stop_codon:yes gene_type:complete
MQNGNGILNSMVRSYFDIQRSRIAISNRISAFKRGHSGAKEEREDKSTFLVKLGTIQDDFQESEGQIEKEIAIELQRYPIWVEWLSMVKGVGPILGGVMITSFDIERNTVSKWWQYAGLNPGMIEGWVPDGVDIVDKGKATERKVPRWKRSGEMIRGDKLTAGYRSPFNKWLRTQLCGKLGPSFLKCGSEYALRFYYPLHVPKARRDELGMGRLDAEDGWKEKKEGHRSRAANRYMVKMFLVDFYNQWRIMEGLPVRVSYAEEYLGRQHSA